MPLLLCLAFLSASYPTDPRWEELDRKVDSLYRQENYAEALTTAREAIREAQKSCCPEDYETFHASLTKYGELLQGQGKYTEAEAVFLSALGSTGGEEPDKDLEMKPLRDLRDLYAVWDKPPETVAYDALLQSSGDEVRAPDIVKARIAEAAKDDKSRQELLVNVAALAVLYRYYEGTRSLQELGACPLTLYIFGTVRYERSA